MSLRRLALLVALFPALLTACHEESPQDCPSDACQETPADTGLDAAEDAEPDAEPDADWEPDPGPERPTTGIVIELTWEALEYSADDLTLHEQNQSDLDLHFCDDNAGQFGSRSDSCVSFLSRQFGTPGLATDAEGNPTDVHVDLLYDSYLAAYPEVITLSGPPQNRSHLMVNPYSLYHPRVRANLSIYHDNELIQTFTHDFEQSEAPTPHWYVATIDWALDPAESIIISPPTCLDPDAPDSMALCTRD
ncbi:hypothetical protein DL240_13200 [Lujinxingia litoralis]|uniref:Uncharacterized protein n=1 Tax=Lujinxingia litoralis TaxID=2211119 RepID=A0A328C6Q6_9DELT|nr:hypothetical protein [Lujinxingia litoralis]RAL21803.1 hypothetical protein DL240_13200 [Lujinxingia litoralis]